MDITGFALRNDRVTIGLVTMILVAGANAFRSLPQAEDPGFTIRVCQITTQWPGANPERVQALVTDKIEKKIQALAELDFVDSTSRTGLSVVSVTVKDEYQNMRPIWDNVRRKMEEVATSLPDGVGPIQVNDEFGEVYGTIVGLTGDGYSYRELKDIALQVRSSFLRLEDAGKVEIQGLQDERVFVEYSNARLSELGLSASQIAQDLESRNIIIPGGSVLTAGERLELEPSGNFASVDDLRRTVINAAGSSDSLHLEDIAEIQRGYVDPPGSLVRINGQEGLAMSYHQKVCK